MPRARKTKDATELDNLRLEVRGLIEELTGLRMKAARWETVYKKLTDYVVMCNLLVGEGQSMLDALTLDHTRLLRKVDALENALRTQHTTSEVPPDAKPS